MKRVLLIVLVLSLTSFSINAQSRKSRGVPAYPFVQKFEQPDGSVIRLKMRGDAVFSWFETEKGEKVLRDKNSWFKYATIDARGYMVASDRTVGSSINNVSSSNVRDTKKIFFSKNQIAEFEDSYFGYKRNTANSMRSSMQKISNHFPSIGKKKSLMILAEFSDVPSVVVASKFYNIMNEVNYNGTGSFRDYYLENSYGAFDVETDILKNNNGDYIWVKLPRTQSYYGAHSGNRKDVNARQMIIDAISAADPYVNFSDYDNDADGYVDNIMVIHSGFGEEGGASDDAIWSHRFFLSANGRSTVEHDGVKVNDYITFPELSGRRGSNSTNIGVLVHEFGHALGLPDLYDTDGEESGGEAFGLGSWDVMCSGSWNNRGITPAHHNAYSKYFLKWLDLPVLNDVNSLTRGEITLKSVSDNKVGGAYMIKTKTQNEFYVIENRQQKLFDKNLPSHGMLVYQVDRTINYIWDYNNVNDDPSHQYMKLLLAGNSSSYQSSIPFPGSSNVTMLSDYTSPSLRNWAGEETNSFITDIREENGLIKFNYMPNSETDLSLTVSFTYAGKLIDMSGARLEFKSISNPSSDVIVGTVGENNKCVLNNFNLGLYNITVKDADRVVDGKKIEFDTEYLAQGIYVQDMQFSLRRAKMLKVTLKYNSEPINFNFSGVKISIDNSSIGPIYNELNSDGECAFKDLYSSKYNIKFDIKSAIINVDGKDMEVFLKDFYELVDFNGIETNLELTIATKFSLEYSYDGSKILPLNFSGDKLSIKSPSNVIIVKDLDDEGNCIIPDLNNGKYEVELNIADKFVSVNGRNVSLSFSKFYSININSPIVKIPIELEPFSNIVDLKVFPNPTTGYIQIEANLSEDAIIRVFNMSGLLVYEKNIVSADLSNKTLHGIDLTGLNAGIYNILIIDGNHKISKRIIKK